MEGYINKWTNMVTRWKKRYLTVNTTTLEYYKNKGEDKKGTIELKNCTVEMSLHDPCKFTINNKTNGEAIYFKANSIQEKIQWINAINGNKEIPQQTKEQQMRKMFAQVLRERIFKERNVINDSIQNTTTESNFISENLKIFKEAVEQQKPIENIGPTVEKMQDSLAKINTSLNDLAQEVEDIKADFLAAVKKFVSLPQQSFDNRNPKSNKNDNNSSDKESSFVEEIFYDAVEAPSPDNETNNHQIQIRSSEPYKSDDERISKRLQIKEETKGPERKYSKEEGEKEETTKERKCLPAKKSNLKVSFWTVLKDLIGKDLSHFALPVYFNEPISFLQKIGECMENEFLLEKAAVEKDPIRRLAYFSTFVAVQYSATLDRRLKPFNPVLGETYEFVTDAYRFASEQVCHHPPISACHVEAKNYIFYFHTNMKTKFWGRSLEFKPLGSTHLYLKTTGEHFSMTRPTSSVHNFIFGKIYVDQIGECISKNHNTGDKGLVHFIAKGWSDKSFSKIEGVFSNSAGAKKYCIKGRWLESITLTDLETQDELPIWRKFPLPANSNDYYNFTYFTFQMNSINDYLRKKLPPTDSRLRPDQRALENGDIKLATTEKLRIEDKQRKARKSRDDTKKEYVPLFFEKSNEGGEEAFIFNGKYWNMREKGDWSSCPDIF